MRGDKGAPAWQSSSWPVVGKASAGCEIRGKQGMGSVEAMRRRVLLESANGCW